MATDKAAGKKSKGNHIYNRMMVNLYYLEVIRGLVKNWPDVVMFRLGLKRKLDINFRNGGTIKINGHMRFRAYDHDLLFTYSNPTQALHTMGLIRYDILEGQYQLLDVKGREVVDIGAYVGDTAICFAMRGARHVYAFEPYPFSYNTAMKNVELNKLGDRVTLINKACSDKGGHFVLDANFLNAPSSGIREVPNGTRIEITTLDRIVKDLKLGSNAVLKVDCEGYEYKVLLGAKRETLRRFGQIIAEYHYGYEPLVQKLKEAGFKVTYTKPRHTKNWDVENHDMQVGIIYARK